MKTTSLPLCLALLGLSWLASAAEVPAATNAPAAPVRRMRPPPIVSPDIQADRHVTFRLQAPKAAEVIVIGQWAEGRAPMSKGSNGVWSVTMSPIEPGVWEYSFQVDGLTMIDPGNPDLKPMRSPRTSILHLPGQPPLLHDFQDVPHGVVRQHTYRSQALGRLRELVVYTPPGYDQQPDVRYPTLYLQHGSGDNQATWVAHGKAHWILDNLLAQGRAKAMVVVMMDGHAATGGGAVGPESNTALFERDLMEIVLPFVEANYRVKTDAANRAIAGLSMGGGQALAIGLQHPDRFAWVGGFSSGIPNEDSLAGLLAQPEAANQQLKLLWIACGKDDFLLKRNTDFIALLTEKHIRHTWRLSEGAHSWPVWRGYLAEFAPLLFQP